MTSFLDPSLIKNTDEYINPFINPNESYKRDLQLLKAAKNQLAIGLVIRTGDDYDTCARFVNDYVNEGFKNGKFIDREITIINRMENGDRELKTTTFLNFINVIEKNKFIVSPTFTTYLNKYQRKSLNSIMLESNVTKRARVKKMGSAELQKSITKEEEAKNTLRRLPLLQKDDLRLTECIKSIDEMLLGEETPLFELLTKDKSKEEVLEILKEAKEIQNIAKDHLALATFYDNMQVAYKLSNNSSSGARLVASTPLFNKSTHPTLTSTCRTATSYANAMNEKLVGGNRHYYDPQVTINNMISIIAIADVDAIGEIVRKYNLRIPTAEHLFKLVIGMCKRYWRDPQGVRDVKAYIDGMTDYQRCAVAYVGDLKSLYRFNKPFIEKFLLQLSSRPDYGVAGSDFIKKLDTDQLTLLGMIGYKYLNGRGVWDLVKSNDPDLPLINGIAFNIIKTLDDYSDFISHFMMTPCMPSNVSYAPEMIRNVVPVSDTDSTIFTVQDWVRDICGTLEFTDKSVALAMSVVYFSSQAIAHVLCQFSAHMGVAVDDIRGITMKNEYYFPILGLADRAKHYFSYVGAKEGVVFNEFDLDLKGVGLRDSNDPPEIRERAKKFTMYILDKMIANQRLDYAEVCRYIVKTESLIRKKLLDGDPNYLTTARINDASSYKQKEADPKYKQFLMWNEVFGPVYGRVENPPYIAIKVSLTTNNRTSFEAYLNRLDNQAIVNNFKQYLEKDGKQFITNVLVPKSIAADNGIPKELHEGMDTRRTTQKLMKPFYYVLESIGIYIGAMKSGDNTVRRLLSDSFTLQEIQAFCDDERDFG